MIINATGVNAGVYPQLVISCDVGATITVTNGVTVIEMVAESETIEINVPNYGEWNITSILDGEENSVVMTVDTARQYNVDITEQVINYTMLYDSGYECDDVTGGWSVYPTTNSSVLASYAKTSNAIDLNGYSYLVTNLKDLTRGNTGTSSADRAIITGHTASYNSAVFADESGCIGVNHTEESDTEGYITTSGFTHTDLSLSTQKKQCIYIGNGRESGSGLNGKVTKNASSISVDWYQDNFTIHNVMLVKNDDWKMVAEIAGITALTINDVLNYSSILLSNEGAVTSMCKTCTGDFMVFAISNSTFMTALNNSPYKNVVLGNEHWSKFLAMVA